MTFNPNTHLVDLTIDEFRELLYQELGPQMTPVDESECRITEPKRVVHGLRGIEELFGVSHRTAQYLKDNVLCEAVVQRGRKIVTDVDLALKLFDERRSNNALGSSGVIEEGRI